MSPLTRERPVGAPPRTASLSDTELPPFDPIAKPRPGHRIRVRGTDVLLRETPGGPGAEPALYVHGLGGASTNWTDLAELLAPWLDGQAFDLPGFGGSGPAPDRDYSMLAQANLVIRFLEQSGRAPVHLVGNSMGGAISINVAARRPDLIRTLTLISPAVPDLRPTRLRKDPVLPLVAMPGIGRLLQRYLDHQTPEQRARGVAQVCFADPSSIPPQRMAQAVEEIRARAGDDFASDAFLRSLRGIIAAYLVPSTQSMWTQLRSIQVPSLVVWGRQDRLVSADLAPRVAAALPQGRLLLLDQVGHVAQMERPVTTARAILGLLER